MKTAQAWDEVVSYVECPDCGETIELGNNVSFAGDEEGHCECGAKFTIIEPGN